MIRNFRPSDIDALIALWNASTTDHPIDNRSFAKNILLDLNFDENGFFVAEEGGELVGFIHSSLHSHTRVLNIKD